MVSGDTTGNGQSHVSDSVVNEDKETVGAGRHGQRQRLWDISVDKCGAFVGATGNNNNNNNFCFVISFQFCFVAQ